MSSLVALAAVLAFVLWRVVDWNGEARLVLAMVFALVALIICKVPVPILARWLS